MTALSASLRTRVLVPELLEALPPDRAEAGLRDLRGIHRHLGGDRVARSVFRGLEPSDASFTVLDVGAASGHFGASIRRSHPRATVTSLDYVPHHLAAATGSRVAADGFALPFRDRSFDYVACSLFLHHFTDQQTVALLASFARIARRGVVAIDLQRHPALYYSLPLIGRLFGWCDITRHDARVSVAAAFTPAELAALAHEAGLDNARIHRHAPWFRMSLVSRVSV